MHKNKIPCLLWVMAIVAFSAASLAFYFFCTTRGSFFIVRASLTRFLEGAAMTELKVEGNLLGRVVLHDLEIRNFGKLPKDSVIKIQQLDISPNLLRPAKAAFKVYNARVAIPGSDTIYSSGNYQAGFLDFNVYSKRVYLNDAVLALVAQNENLRGVTCLMDDPDIYIKGLSSSPQISGTLHIAKLSRDIFLLEDCPISLNLKLENSQSSPRLNGELSSTSGLISARDVAINLKQSKVSFSGNPMTPMLDLKGITLIEGVKINIRLKGTMDKPILRLNSEPPLPEYQLMIMLVTGKSWKSVVSATDQGILTPDVFVDFIDYFALGNSGVTLARKLGISDFSVKFNEQTKGVEVKKDVTQKVGLSYGVEETQVKDNLPEIEHKVGASYEIIDGVTVGGEKGFKQVNLDTAQNQTETDDKVYLEIKKKF